MRMSIMARMNASDVMGGEDRSGRCDAGCTASPEDAPRPETHCSLSVSPPPLNLSLGSSGGSPPPEGVVVRTRQSAVASVSCVGVWLAS